MILKLWTDDTSWYWATDLTDLERLIVEFEGDTYEEMTGEALSESWHELPVDETFTMHGMNAADLPSNVPEGAVVEDNRMTASVSAWREVSKPGFFASTEW